MNFILWNVIKKKYEWIKIDNHTERGVRGYYKLRKAELIHALDATRLVEPKSDIFDEYIPKDPTPILQPTSSRLSNITTKIKQKYKKFDY